ncbi:MAG: 5'-deoxynucleotidase [Lachnospiraceae bacterium]|nr:5'-deoxynucleotidase [Lachnospiraceae bacterium]
MEYNFYATVARMKYIERWALMRNTITENLSEHSLEVSMVAHALCVIGNKRYGKALNGEKAALIGIYHDASEIITGDMPTPVKYYNKSIKDAFKSLEDEANRSLLNQLPEDMKEAYEDIFFKTEDYSYEWKLVKAADKISAMIKCMEEEKTGNREFVKAKEAIEKALIKMSEELPEVKDFIEEFLPAFSKTLDELN